MEKYIFFGNQDFSNNAVSEADYNKNSTCKCMCCFKSYFTLCKLVVTKFIFSFTFLISGSLVFTTFGSRTIISKGRTIIMT